MICRQGDLGADTDAPSAKLAEQRVVLNQREQGLASIEEPTPEIIECSGISENLVTNLAQVLVDRHLQLISYGLGGLRVNTKHERLLTPLEKLQRAAYRRLDFPMFGVRIANLRSFADHFFEDTSIIPKERIAGLC